MKNPTNYRSDLNSDDQFIMMDAMDYGDDAFAPGVIDDFEESMPPASDAQFWEHTHDEDDQEWDPVADGFHPGHA